MFKDENSNQGSIQVLFCSFLGGGGGEEGCWWRGSMKD